MASSAAAPVSSRRPRGRRRAGQNTARAPTSCRADTADTGTSFTDRRQEDQKQRGDDWIELDAAAEMHATRAIASPEKRAEQAAQTNQVRGWVAVTFLGQLPQCCSICRVGHRSAPSISESLSWLRKRPGKGWRVASGGRSRLRRRPHSPRIHSNNPPIIYVKSEADYLPLILE